MKVVFFSFLLLLLSAPAAADEIILVYNGGNSLFVPSAGKSITSSSDCADNEIAHLLQKFGMTLGSRIGSDIVDMLDGYYAFQIADSKGTEAADSLSALASISVAAENGSVHTLYGATRDPGDYWYNHSFKWDLGHHHYGCEDSTYVPSEHYRQWFLPRAGYDRAWTVTTGSPDNVIAIIDSSFEVDHPDLNSKWAWNSAENGGQPLVDDDGNGYIDDVLGWDFGQKVSSPPTLDDIYVRPGDPDVGHDQRWWELMGCDSPWNCPCDPDQCVCNGTLCAEFGNKNGFGTTRHGTNMASIIAAETSENPNGTGMAGINWSTKILPIKIGNEYENRIDVPNSLWIMMTKALEYVAIRKQQGLNIVALNMSLTFDGIGHLIRNEDLMPLFDPIFDRLRNQYGIVLLGGAGNFRNDADSPLHDENEASRYFPIYPCRNEDVFCATCVGFYNQIHSYSQFYDSSIPQPPLPFGQENVDLCAYGAEKTWCGVNYPHGFIGVDEDSVFVDCTISALGGLPYYPQMIVASSETTYRPHWSLCGDVPCAAEAECSQGVFTELTPVWGVSEYFTSGATAQLSGLVGLVASVS